VRDRPGDICRAAVSLQLDRVDLVSPGEPGDDRAHRRNVHVGAVQHDQRIARAGDFVIHPYAVDVDTMNDRLRLHRTTTYSAASTTAILRTGSLLPSQTNR